MRRKPRYNERMNKCARCGKPCPRRWCSQLCHAADRKTVIDVTCPHCSTVFHPKVTEVNRGGGRFCSVTCRRAFKAAHSVNYPKIGKKAIHRIIAAATLGRDLLPGEVVHHIDGDRQNFHPDNLHVYKSHSHHIRDEARNGRVGFSTHDQAVQSGRLSGAARRARKASPVSS